MSLDLAGVGQQVVRKPEDESHEPDDPDLQPVFRGAGVPLQRDAHLKQLPGHEEHEQERDDQPKRRRREEEHDQHQPEGQGLQPGGEEDVEDAAELRAAEFRLVLRKYVPIPVRDHEQGLQRAVDGEQDVPEPDLVSRLELGAQLFAKCFFRIRLEGRSSETLEDVPGGAEDEHDVEAEVPVEVAVDPAPLEVQKRRNN